MIRNSLRKTFLAASLVAACGGLAAGQAWAHGASSGAPQATRDAGDKVSDAWITTKVKTEFATTEGVSFTDIAVDTVNGTVALSGTVGSGAEIDRAKQVAMTIEGVKSVDTSGLTVSAAAAGVDADAHAGVANNDNDGDRDIGDAASDTWITTKIKAEFATDEGVSLSDIAVDTVDGVVSLSGTVESGAEVDRAKQVAMSVKGVTSVNTSGLTVASK